VLGPLLMFMICSIMYEIAEVSDESPVIWGGVTLVLLLLSKIVIPWPLINYLIAGIVSWALMFAVHLIRESRNK
jgi:hypothetical protein